MNFSIVSLARELLEILTNWERVEQFSVAQQNSLGPGIRWYTSGSFIVVLAKHNKGRSKVTTYVKC